MKTKLFLPLSEEVAEIEVGVEEVVFVAVVVVVLVVVRVTAIDAVILARTQN